MKESLEKRDFERLVDYFLRNYEGRIWKQVYPGGEGELFVVESHDKMLNDILPKLLGKMTELEDDYSPLWKTDDGKYWFNLIDHEVHGRVSSLYGLNPRLLRQVPYAGELDWRPYREYTIKDMTLFRERERRRLEKEKKEKEE